MQYIAEKTRIKVAIPGAYYKVWNGIRTRKNRLSGKTIVDEMSNLDSVCLWYPKKRKPEQMMEEPTKIQGKILKTFGYEIEKGVLQNLDL